MIIFWVPSGYGGARACALPGRSLGELWLADGRIQQPVLSLSLARRAITDVVADSPFSAGELRAAAESHHELAPEYRDAVVDSFVERIGKEIDARVDARLVQASARPSLTSKQLNVLPVVALGSIALGIPISGIAAGTSGFGDFWWSGSRSPRSTSGMPCGCARPPIVTDGRPVPWLAGAPCGPVHAQQASAGAP